MPPRRIVLQSSKKKRRKKVEREILHNKTLKFEFQPQPNKKCFIYEIFDEACCDIDINVENRK